MQVVDPQIQLDPQGAQRYPFADFYKANQDRTRVYTEMLAQNMLEDLQTDFEEGHQSNNPLRQRNRRNQQRGGAYFSVQTYLTLDPQFRKLPVFYITSTAVNSLAYEASHGNMQRLLATYAARI